MENSLPKLNYIEPCRSRGIQVFVNEHMKDWDPELNMKHLKSNIHNIIKVFKKPFFTNKIYK